MVYQYLAYNEAGRIVKGKLTAATEEAANELLGYAGYKLVKLKLHTPFFSWLKLSVGRSHIKPAEVIIFFHQLAILLESGNSVTASLEILQKQADNPTKQKVLDEVISDLRGGTQLSVAMSKHPKVFSLLNCRLLAVGEQSGNLETVLKQIADDMEKEVTTGKEIQRAMMYPVVTFVIAIGVVGILLTFVLPAFTRLYTSLNIELPQVTKVVISLSNGLRTNGLPIMLSVFIIVVAILLYTRTERGRYYRDKLLLEFPYLGRVRHLLELARCCRSLSLLLGAGLPLTDGIPLISQSCGNKVIARGLSDIHRSMLKGEGLSNPMSQNKFFLPLMLQMVRVGEETGNLDITLLAVAKSYSVEADYKLKSAIALLEPALTVFIGLIVGLIALSMTSALYGIYGRGF